MTAFNLLTEAIADGFRPTVKSRGKVGGQFNGPCIIASGCGGVGRDRLRIQPHIGNYGRFVCNVCGLSGSGVDWLMLMRGMPKNEALAYVGWIPQDGSQPQLLPQKALPAGLSLAERSETWQINAYNFARMAYAQMSDEARSYLHRRGITNEMIVTSALGQYDHYKKVKARTWGENDNKWMVIPRGIVIPWLDQDHNVRCVRVRRLPWDESSEAKRYYGVDKDGSIGRYRALSGVDSSHFYNGYKITLGCKVALFEGEFTCIVAQEAVKDLGIVCVATGSTSWCRNDANVRLLAACERVLLCFDTDENQAGDNASTWWLDRLSNAVRWRPLWSDANDMARDGFDVGEWLALGFEQSWQDEDQSVCTVCQAEVEHFSVEGQPYCQVHYEHLPWYLRCDAPAQTRKEATLLQLVEQFQRDYPEKAVPYDLLLIVANFPSWSVTVSPR